MVRELIHDPIFLSLASEPATACDGSVAEDLLDTLIAHKDECVGMAANMIGERKRIIAFWDESGKSPRYTVMFNPEIVAGKDSYETAEGCLSLPGGPRPCRRYRWIRVRYQTAKMESRCQTFTGFTAQIVQHEIDHEKGILI